MDGAVRREADDGRVEMRPRRQMKSKQGGSRKPEVERAGAGRHGSLVSEAEAAKAEASKYRQDPKSHHRIQTNDQLGELNWRSPPTTKRST